MDEPATLQPRARSRFLRPFRAAWIQTRRLLLFFRNRYARPVDKLPIDRLAATRNLGKEKRKTVDAFDENSSDRESRMAGLWVRFRRLPASHRAWTFAACTGTIGILLLLWWQWSGRIPLDQTKLAGDGSTASVEPTPLISEPPKSEPFPEGTSTSLLDKLAAKPPESPAEEIELTRPEPANGEPQLTDATSGRPATDPFGEDLAPEPTRREPPQLEPPAANSEPVASGNEMELEIEREAAPAHTGNPPDDKGEEFTVSSADAKPVHDEPGSIDSPNDPDKRWAPTATEQIESPVDEPDPKPSIEAAPKTDPNEPVREPEKPADPPTPRPVPHISTVEPGPRDLNVTITRRGPSEASVGQPLRYELIVRNVGNKTIDRVIVEDQVPPEHKIAHTSPAAEIVDRKLHWDLSDLRAGDEHVLSVSLLPMTAGPVESVTTVRPFAHVSSGTRVESPLVQFAVTAPAQVGVGQRCRIGFQVTNAAAAPLENVRVLLDLPAGVAYAKGHELVYDVGTLAPGETRAASLIATGKTIGTGECRGRLQSGRESIGSGQASMAITTLPAQSGNNSQPAAPMSNCCGW